MDEVEEIVVTAEEQELVFKGIRPKNMDYEVFKKVRKDLAKATKRYLGGQFIHISTNTNPMYDNSIDVKGTYVKDKKETKSQ